MKKITGMLLLVLSSFAMSAQAADSLEEPPSPPIATADKPIQVGSVCMWQPKLIADWLAEKCVPGVASTNGKGKVTLIVSDGIIFLYPHFGRPKQNPPHADLVRASEDLFGGRNKVKAWAAKNGVPIYDPNKQL